MFSETLVTGPEISETKGVTQGPHRTIIAPNPRGCLLNGAPDPNQAKVKRALDASIKDGVFYSIMTGAAESYFSAFAVSLRATAPQVGLLATLPPLIASFSQLFSVWFSQKTGLRLPVIILGAILQTAALLGLILAPYVQPDLTFTALLFAIIAYHVGPNLGAPLWASIVGQLVPESLRGRFFARRTRLSTIASFSALLGAGIILQLFDQIDAARMGFIIIFCAGACARLVSAVYLGQMFDPLKEEARAAAMAKQKILPTIRQLAAQPSFLRFSCFVAMMQFSVAISGPFVVVYLLKDLQFSYLELTLNTAASVFVQFMVLSRWGRLSDLFGNRILLRVTGALVPVVPLFWLVSPNFYYLLAVQMFSGLVWSGFTLSINNTLFDLSAGLGRSGLIAMHNIFANCATFSGAAFGSLALLNASKIAALLPEALEFESVFLMMFALSSLIRFMTAMAFLPRLIEVRSVRRMSYQGIIFRVTRFSPISGVVFDAISRIKRADDPTR